MNPAVTAPGRRPFEDLVPSALFRAEVRSWATRIGVEPREVHVRPMRRKWASCSTKGRLTFDAGLLRESARVRTEVIVHELLHLKVPNHGRLFRSLVRAHLGTSELLLERQPGRKAVSSPTLSDSGPSRFSR